MRPEKRVPPGRHALFSGGDPNTAAPVTPKTKTNGVRPPLAGMTRPAYGARPARLKRAPTKARSAKPITTVKPVKSVKKVTKPARTVSVTAAPAVRGRSGPIGLSCSKCGTHSDVAILRYLVLHLPYWVWRPGRGYTSLMKCPACGKRTWVSASWGPGEH